MNCFQNCIFTYDSQRWNLQPFRLERCELLSELYFYLWFPTGKYDINKPAPLWIAFRIVFLLMIPNMVQKMVSWTEVVNCFQNCIFTYDSQHHLKLHHVLKVVNCFQNCIFTYDSQQESDPFFYGVSCELLSELYFYLWFPTSNRGGFISQVLWIAFRIVFLLMIPNFSCLFRFARSVVNCFQNCIFTYDSQRDQFVEDEMTCCELLSELYFYLWFPTHCVFQCIECSCELLSELYFYLWFPTD